MTAGVLAGLVPAAPAAAFSLPSCSCACSRGTRTSRWATGSRSPPRPALAYLGGYQIGYRLQASGEPNELQRVALTVAGVPDGQPSQPYNAQPYCVTRAGAVGSIVEAGPELQFEGNGTYTVTVSVGPSAGGADGCKSGPSSTGSFSAGAQSRRCCRAPR